jgi:hypothetical protein
MTLMRRFSFAGSDDSWRLTFPDILSDPLVRAMMAADHVDPLVLRADLTRIASVLPRVETTEDEDGCCRAC